MLLFGSGESDTSLIETVFGYRSEISSGGDFIFATGNAVVRLAAKPASGGDAIAATEPVHNRLRGLSVIFSVRDLAVTAAVLADNGVSCAEAGGRLVVPVAPGQGVEFAFEEK